MKKTATKTLARATKEVNAACAVKYGLETHSIDTPIKSHADLLRYLLDEYLDMPDEFLCAEWLTNTFAADVLQECGVITEGDYSGRDMVAFEGLATIFIFGNATASEYINGNKAVKYHVHENSSLSISIYGNAYADVSCYGKNNIKIECAMFGKASVYTDGISGPAIDILADSKSDIGLQINGSTQCKVQLSDISTLHAHLSDSARLELNSDAACLSHISMRDKSSVVMCADGLQCYIKKDTGFTGSVYTSNKSTKPTYL